jgi:hypothetical protein
MMPAARGASILILLAAAGCAATPTAPIQRLRMAPTMSTEARAAIDLTASQVRRCYRAPRVSSAGRQIITRLLIRIAPDGALNGLPELISQSGVHPGNQNFAPRMAEAAILAVMNCAPYRLPPGFADGEPIEIELTFSPLASA